MVFDQIEKLKHDFTDKYVIVDETSPELARFRGQTGIVKTVNMSGRALVQFDANNNIGWYDIDLGFLKVIAQPLTDAEKAAAKRGPLPEAPAPQAAAPAKPAAAAAPAAPPAKEAAVVAAPVEAAAAPAEEAVVEAAAAPAPKKAAAGGGKPKAGELKTPEIMAWCRAHDAK